MKVVKVKFNMVIKYLKNNSYIAASLIVLIVLLLSLFSFLFVKSDKIDLPFLGDTYYKVVFEYYNGEKNVIKKVKRGKKVVKPDAPKKNSYDFMGWYNEDELYDFDTKVYSDLVLSARYGVSSENIVVDKNDNSLVGTKEEGKTDLKNNNSSKDKNSFNKKDPNKKEDDKDKDNLDNEDPKKDDKEDENIPPEEIIPPKHEAEEDNNHNNNNNNNSKIEITFSNNLGCIKKGNVCGESIISQGIRLKVEITTDRGKEVHYFYVLSNTDTEMYCIYEKNFGGTVAYVNYIGILSSFKQKFDNKFDVRLPKEDEVVNLIKTGYPCWFVNELAGEISQNQCSGNPLATHKGFWVLGGKVLAGYGAFTNSDLSNSSNYGIRPVITIPKQ